MFGKNQADHYNALRAVLQRMKENNLTANPDKRLFNQSSLINASPPRNATEARGFLGLAQYLARFIKDFASVSSPIR